MKSGIVRKIDELGRIVIPKEIRKTLKLNTGDEVEIFVDDNKVYLKRFSTLLGLEEELFNISKVINEQFNCSIIFADQNKIIVSYGKLSEKYLDMEINDSIYKKITDLNFVKFENINITNNYTENRKTYIAPIYNKKSIQGLFIIIENDKPISLNTIESINSFKKFIIKQLDS